MTFNRPEENATFLGTSSADLPGLWAWPCGDGPKGGLINGLLIDRWLGFFCL